MIILTIIIVLAFWYFDPRVDTIRNGDTIIWYGRKERKWFKLKDIIGW